MSSIIQRAMFQANDEAEQAAVCKAKELIRKISDLHQQRASLAEKIVELRKELNALTHKPATADEVLGA